MKTWWAKSVLIGSIAGAMLLPIGALGSRLGLWPFTIGFLFLAIGVVIATLAAAIGIIGLIVAAAKSMRSELAALGIGSVVGLLVLGVMGVQFNSAQSVPPIHNITTDTEDPPMFDAIVEHRKDALNAHTYDAMQMVGERTLSELQRTAFPEVATLRAQVSLDAAVDRAVEAIDAMGMEVVNVSCCTGVDVDRSQGIVEATATTFWFGFKDDVVVRLREAGDDVLVDVRSVSRVGQSDLGVNAHRILTFLERFRSSG